MFCSACGSQQSIGAQACAACATPTYATPAAMSSSHGQPYAGSAAATDGVPPAGVKGWSWGAFFLSWIWAIGNRTWIGLLALIPYVGFFVAIWLGFKGREMAWRNTHWDSVEHFNRVQRRWSIWGTVLVLLPMVFILLAVALPAYQSYVDRARAAQQQVSAEPMVRHVSTVLSAARVALPS